jgi:hypothetical protein
MNINVPGGLPFAIFAKGGRFSLIAFIATHPVESPASKPFHKILFFVASVRALFVRQL